MPRRRSERNADARWASSSDGTFELRTGEALLARISLHIAVPTTTARVATSRAQWDLALSGLVIRRLTVHEAETPDGPALLEVRPDWRHRWSLTIPARDVLRWRPRLTTPDWVCEGKHGEVLIQLATVQGATYQWHPPTDAAAEVYVAEAIRELAELPLVLGIGWFLMLLYSMEIQAGVFREA
jgi:hypothetical protein